MLPECEYQAFKTSRRTVLHEKVPGDQPSPQSDPRGDVCVVAVQISIRRRKWGRSSRPCTSSASSRTSARNVNLVVKGGVKFFSRHNVDVTTATSPRPSTTSSRSARRLHGNGWRQRPQRYWKCGCGPTTRRSIPCWTSMTNEIFKPCPSGITTSRTRRRRTASTARLLQRTSRISSFTRLQRPT